MKYRPSELRKKLTNIRTYLNTVALERESETDSALIAILAPASCFLLGDAGAGKTYHIEAITDLMGLRIFDTLLSQSTKPEQIFGPVDVPALAQGIQRQKIKGYAPDAHVLFFDEVFKANDVVLNPLLWLLASHKFRNGDDGIIICPTITTFGASNEVPTAKGDRPIYDRFLIRHDVSYIKAHKNMHLLLDLAQSKDVKVKPEALSLQEVRILSRLCRNVVMTHEIWDMVIKIRDQVQNGVGVVISDRRMVQCIPVLKANAFIHNRDVVDLIDLEMLSHMFWDLPEQSRKVKTIVLANCNVEKGDILSYQETADSLYEKAVKTGDFNGALVKLRQLAGTTKQMVDSSTGRTVHRTVISHIRTVKNVLSNRQSITVFDLMDADGHKWIKLSEASASVWAEAQLRSVGFKWRRTLGYWWRPMKGVNAYIQFTKLVAKHLHARVEKKGIS